MGENDRAILGNVLVDQDAGLAVINAAGVYAQLVAAHVGERGAAVAGLETQDAALGARIEVAAHRRRPRPAARPD